ncbi:4-vinyl reductase 4VR [Methanococcus aeolicus Nankai-3]|uniref:4-vinyl reductase 4VR n=1 Tax=Methanococcus aeolicus (strain ATCC BAA-1280 / DSM 17508 / OCM 812 / Nankai-3) TaxID=419665 RepID=A6UUH8_META3|nr:DUF2507 domain-containing protein [Methanococcus aeolicus]ABR56150.1 4-vinyl reductase 4VR [Methanococcus aeolicus Nankai-3]
MPKYDINQLSTSHRKEFGRNIDITVFRLVRFMDLKKSVGKEHYEIVYEAGKKLGHELNPKTVEEVIIFCKDHKIGMLEIVGENPLQIRVNECICCNGLPECGETLCHFEGGLIAGCLEKIFNKKVQAIETHCAGLGDEFCQFELKIY